MSQFNSKRYKGRLCCMRIAEKCKFIRAQLSVKTYLDLKMIAV